MPSKKCLSDRLGEGNCTSVYYEFRGFDFFHEPPFGPSVRSAVRAAYAGKHRCML
jgi:hypothetical protein